MTMTTLFTSNYFRVSVTFTDEGMVNLHLEATIGNETTEETRENYCAYSVDGNIIKACIGDEHQGTPMEFILQGDTMMWEDPDTGNKIVLTRQDS